VILQAFSEVSHHVLVFERGFVLSLNQISKTM